MRRALFLLTLVAAMVFACAGVVLAQARAPDTSQLDRYIVVLKEDADPEQGADKAQREHGASIRHVYDGAALNGYAAVIPEGRLTALSRDPDVAFIDKDTLVYADVSTGGATGVDRIDGEPNTADVSDGSGAKAAVLDTGIDLDHPDLDVVNGINTISTTGTIYPDCSLGRTNTGPTSADDNNGHGTHVAGTIGAKNNGAGVVGVAPGAKLYAVKVLNAQGSGYVSDIICGMNWVTSTHSDPDATNDIDTANMSLGGTGSDDGQSCAATAIAYKKAICNSVGEGVTYVVSAGNDGADLATKRPASFRDRDDATGTSKPLVLTVTAVSDYDGKPGGLKGTVSDTSTYCRTGTDDTPASFSNYATTTVDRDHTIAAPGVCILSTAPGGGTTTKSGTSMAAPHITGTVALCLRSGGSCSSSGTTTPGQIISTLRTDAQDAPAHPDYGWSGAPGTSKYYGYLEYAGDYRSGAGPDTTITSGPEGPTNDNTPTFEFTSGDSTASFECRLTKQRDTPGSFEGCTSPLTYPTQSDATYTFEVRAIDSAGTVDLTPAKRTWTVDTTAPTVSNASPTDRAGNVALNDNVTVTFSKDMEAATLTDPNNPTFTLKGPDGSLVDAALSYDATSKTATLNPSAKLAVNTTYTATVTTGVTDKVGNSLADNKVWSFTTTDDTTPPTVESVSPLVDARDVLRDTNVVAKFLDEDIVEATVTRDTFMLAPGPDAPTPTTRITAAVSYDPTTRTAKLNPYGSSTSVLERCKRYTAKVTSGITDEVGNPAVEKVWTFKTRGC